MTDEFAEDEFSRFIHESEYESQAELIGLTLFYLEERVDMYKSDTSDIQALLNGSRISTDDMNVNKISARIGDLREGNYVTVVDNTSPYSYRLTFEGLEKFQNIAADIEAIATVRRELFIEFNEMEIEYYRKLISNINKSYQYGINDGCLVLTRKLFENLIIEILRAEYGGQGIDLYYNTDRGRFHGLGTLCGNLREKVSDLDHYSRQLDDTLVDRIEHFKEQGNSQAHSVRVDIGDEEMKQMREEATELTEILYNIREEVRIANGS